MNQSTLIALDIAKQVFHIVMFGCHGQVTTRKKVKRGSLLKFIAQQPCSKIVMEACGTSHHWARQFQSLGHSVVLLPPQHVKAYVRGQKNDYNDALAIGEACLHNRIRPVPIKSVSQQDDQSFQRLRKHWIQARGNIVRQLRGLLAEYGIVFSRGIGSAKKHLRWILDDPSNGLSESMRALIARQYERLLEVEKECDWYDQQLKHKVKQDDVCQRLKCVPGYGDTNSFAAKHWMGDGLQFRRGREASSAMGVVPRQHTSGDKQKLMGITKKGDKEVRALIVHGARSVVSRAKNKNDKLSQWINAIVARRGFNKAVIAYANKMVRIAWVIIARGEHYQADVTPSGASVCH